MASAGRNDPCPCGSGRKHKHCCRSQAAEEPQSGVGSGHRAVETALSWLRKHHRLSVQAALEEDFFGLLPEEALDRLEELPAGLQEMVVINVNEWLLAQAELPLRDGRVVRASDLVLGPGGPFLTVVQRSYLEVLAARPLGLYEVRESRPNQGLSLKNLLDENEPEMWIEEKSGSQGLVQWDVLGTRLIFVDDRWQIAGSIYPFNPEQGARVRKAIVNLLRIRKIARAKWHSTLANDLLAEVVIGSWLSLLTMPRQMPEIVDAGTGDPLMLVTDHYDVLDWDRLAAALEAQPDVDGDRKDGWVRYVELDSERRRLIFAVNIGKKRNRVETLARTIRLADEGRSWLQRIAGDSLHFLTREMADPRSPRAREELGSRSRPGARSPSDSDPDAPSIELPPEMTQALYEQMYKDWAIIPIPALGNRTPRQAVRSRAGREQVVELLKQYESSDLHRARREGQPPVDFEFLWKSVGLARRSVDSTS